MLKCCELMYCFELDGTLVDNVPSNSKNYFIRNIKLHNAECAFNPNKYDIRWTLVTNRPKIDSLCIRYFCFKNGLVPCQIIHLNKFKNIKNINKISEQKIKLFKDILDGKHKVLYTKNKIKRIINVCNNQTENYYINSCRNGYEFISVNVIDFKREFFNKIV